MLLMQHLLLYRRRVEVKSSLVNYRAAGYIHLSAMMNGHRSLSCASSVSCLTVQSTVNCLTLGKLVSCRPLLCVVYCWAANNEPAAKHIRVKCQTCYWYLDCQA